ncbi:glycerophosphodiester phosphodiesterase family protein, partial [Bacillus licheniformis]|uniref:glycerophosphodiester phosphodiesterase family protein n=1 Tax=Bacillus licheniformis TaxID=1402 RepID=UPI003F698330
EVDNLKALKKLTGIRLIQLMDAEGGPADHAVDSYATMATPAGLKVVATYAFGIGPNKSMVGAGKPLVHDAHIAGLRVHPWTYRAENAFLP